MTLAKLTGKIRTIDTRRGAPVAQERIRGYELTKIRQRIGLRDEWTCRLCGMVTQHGEVDHVVPLHLGGQETDKNRQYLCSPCHRSKSEKEEKNRQ